MTAERWFGFSRRYQTGDFDGIRKREPLCTDRVSGIAAENDGRIDSGSLIYIQLLLRRFLHVEIHDRH